MGERKVLNKYYPPDFDPDKLPKGQRRQNNEMKVRMMLPMSVRCKTCGHFMYKGTKFTTRKEDVMGEDYLGIQVFRFYYRCRNCAAEFTMKTDPKNSDYVMEEGASRNYEPWRETDKQTAEAMAAREEEERGNAMKALENRTLDSKREMDLMAALDEMRSLRARHAAVTTEQALAALQREADGGGGGGGAGGEGVVAAGGGEELPEEDRAALAEFFAQQKTIMRRLESDSDGSSGEDEAGGAGGRREDGDAGPGPGQQAGGDGAGPGPSSSSGLAAGRANGDHAAAGGGSSMPPPAGKPADAAVARPKVMVKAKRPAAGANGAGDSKRPKQAAEEGGAGGGGGLAGLLGGYGSDDSGSK